MFKPTVAYMKNLINTYVKMRDNLIQWSLEYILICNLSVMIYANTCSGSESVEILLYMLCCICLLYIINQ